MNIWTTFSTPTSAISPVMPPRRRVCSVLWTPSTKCSRAARSFSVGSKAMPSPETAPSARMSRTTRPSTLHRLSAGGVDQREPHLLPDGDSLARHREQHAAATEIAGVTRDLTGLAVDLCGDVGLGSRAPGALSSSPPDSTGESAQGAEWCEPLSHRLPRAVELHRDAGCRAHLRHLGGDLVHHVAHHGDPLAGERQDQLDPHAFADAPRSRR